MAKEYRWLAKEYRWLARRPGVAWAAYCSGHNCFKRRHVLDSPLQEDFLLLNREYAVLRDKDMLGDVDEQLLLKELQAGAG